MERLLNHPVVLVAKFAVLRYVGRRRAAALAAALLVLFGAGATLKIIAWLTRKYKLSQRRAQKRHQCKLAFKALADSLTLDSKVKMLFKGLPLL